MLPSHLHIWCILTCKPVDTKLPSSCGLVVKQRSIKSTWTSRNCIRRNNLTDDNRTPRRVGIKLLSTAFDRFVRHLSDPLVWSLEAPWRKCSFEFAVGGCLDHSAIILEIGFWNPVCQFLRFPVTRTHTAWNIRVDSTG